MEAEAECESPGRQDPRHLTLTGKVGFDSLPRQLVSKALAQGFSFNVLCVGETGIGKSTLMNTLFHTVFEADEGSHFESCVCLRPRTYCLQECGVRLRLTIVHAVGFGDQLVRDCGPVVDYVDAQLESYLQEELRAPRCLLHYQDTRVHACLYFLTPTGHSLKALDLLTLKQLDGKVNLIPVIAKADTLTQEELPRFKSLILGELGRHGVSIYRGPTDDEAVADANADMNALLPFAVVGSTELVELGGRVVRGRCYPWGVVEVDDDRHCDSARLRDMLIGFNMEDLREQTHRCHYERYRRQKLEGLGCQEAVAALEEQRREHAAELRRRERLLRQGLACRARDVEARVKEKERELCRRFEELKCELHVEKRKVEEKRRQLEEDKHAFNVRRAAAAEAVQTQAVQTQAVQTKAVQTKAVQTKAVQTKAVQTQAVQQVLTAQALQAHIIQAQAEALQAHCAQMHTEAVQTDGSPSVPQHSTPKKSKGKIKKH